MWLPLRSWNFTPDLFPAGNPPQRVAQSAEGISVFAGTGNGGEPPGHTGVWLYVVAMTVPRYVRMGSVQPSSVTRPPGPPALIWLPATPVTSPLYDFASTVPPAPLASPAACALAGTAPVPKATAS